MDSALGPDKRSTGDRKRGANRSPEGDVIQVNGLRGPSLSSATRARSESLRRDRPPSRIARRVHRHAIDVKVKEHSHGGRIAGLPSTASAWWSSWPMAPLSSVRATGRPPSRRWNQRQRDDARRNRMRFRTSTSRPSDRWRERHGRPSRRFRSWRPKFPRRSQSRTWRLSPAATVDSHSRIFRPACIPFPRSAGLRARTPGAAPTSPIVTATVTVGANEPAEVLLYMVAE